MTESKNGARSAAVQGKWQFTLRELVLLFVAVSAIAGMIVIYSVFSTDTTPLAKQRMRLAAAIIAHNQCELTSDVQTILKKAFKSRVLDRGVRSQQEGFDTIASEKQETEFRLDKILPDQQHRELERSLGRLLTRYPTLSADAGEVSIFGIAKVYDHAADWEQEVSGERQIPQAEARWHVHKGFEVLKIKGQGNTLVKVRLYLAFE